LLAQGTPMLCAGDELGNSQQGNNNAYCQDNATGWLDWSAADYRFKDFVAQLLALRRAEPALRSNDWSSQSHGQTGPQRRWRRPDGQEMLTHDWHAQEQHAFACELLCTVGEANGYTGPQRLLLVFNPDPAPVRFTLDLGHWRLLLDSSGELTPSDALENSLLASAQAVLVLRASV